MRDAAAPRAAGPPRVLTVAGSDPGGGAGLQLDLKVFAALGADGAAVPAVLTVQGRRGLSAAVPVPGPLVAAALRSVFSAGGLGAVKTGALGTAAAVGAVAAVLARRPEVPLVCDPVLAPSRAARRGVRLLVPAALPVLRSRLLPRATVLTPNLAEAAALLGRPVRTRREAERAAVDLLDLGPRAVLLKGGHLAPRNAECSDCFCERGGEPIWITAPRLPGATSVHGTGCALSSALAVFLARGLPVASAALRAREAVQEWLREARGRRLAPVPLRG